MYYIYIYKNAIYINKSHQPSGRQVVSDLRVSIHPSNCYIQCVCTVSIPPTPTSNPLYCTGGGVQPSSPLLPWPQNHGAKQSRSHLYPIFSPSRPSSFFHHFFNTISYRFLLDFASQLGAQIHPKSIKNRSQERSGKLPTFCIDFSSNFDGFEGCWNLVFELLASTGSKFSTF